MVKRGKKYRSVRGEAEEQVILSVDDALAGAKEHAYAKFDESVDVAVNLGIDASKGDQVVRGSVLLPNGRGKTVKVLVFAKGEYADKATAAGADYVGLEDLIEKIEGGWIDFDFAVATPDVMSQIGKLARILGSKGLLPNKKVGTVTFDVADIVADLKKGRFFFKNDKSAIVHFSIGKVSFTVDQLKENLMAFAKALVAAKPPASKGRFLKKASLASTMGVAMPVSVDDIIKQMSS